VSERVLEVDRKAGEDHRKCDDRLESDPPAERRPQPFAPAVIGRSGRIHWRGANHPARTSAELRMQIESFGRVICMGPALPNIDCSPITG